MSHAARYQELASLVENGYFALVEGAKHSSFGVDLHFDRDDLDIVETNADILEDTLQYMLVLILGGKATLVEYNQFALLYLKPLFEAELKKF